MGCQVCWGLSHTTVEMGLSHLWFWDQESPTWPCPCLLTSKARGRGSCSDHLPVVYFSLLLLVQKLFLSWVFGLNQVPAWVLFCPKTFIDALCEGYWGVLQLLGVSPSWTQGPGQELKWVLRYYKLKMGHVTLKEIKVDVDIYRKSEYIYKNYIYECICQVSLISATPCSSTLFIFPFGMLWQEGSDFMWFQLFLQQLILTLF